MRYSDQNKERILSSLQYRETEDLLRIWHLQDRSKWTADAFDVIHDLLLARLGEVPSPDPSLAELASGPLEEPSTATSRLAWTEIAIRLLVGFQVFGFIISLPTLTFYLPSTAPGTGIPPWVLFAMLAVTLAIPTGIGIFLWKNAKRIAKWLWRYSELDINAASVSSFTFDQVSSFALGVLGIYGLFVSLTSALASLGSLFSTLRQMPGSDALDPYTLPLTLRSVGSIVLVILSLVLILSPGRVARILHGLWNPFEIEE